MRNKLYIILIGILCFGMMVNCEIPQSVAVKGHPGLYINLGSPFGSNNTLVDDYLDLDGLTSQMGDGFDGDIHPYKYNAIKIDPNNSTGGTINGETEVQTYFIHFPIAEVPFDLTQYLKDTNENLPITIPSITSSGYISYPYPLPSTNLELKDITKLVNYININNIAGGKKSRLILKGTGVKDLQPQIEVQVTNLGITTYSKGVPDTIDGKDVLVFSATQDVHFYSGSDKLTVELRLVAEPAASGNFSIDVDLEWKDAEVNPGTDGIFTDKISGLKFNALSDFLGGAQFTKIPGYLYVDGLTNAKFGLKAIKSNATAIDIVAFPAASNITAPHPYPSDILNDDSDFIKDVPTYNVAFSLQDVFNSTGDVTLDYKLEIPTINIINDNTIADKKIKIDMVVVLPLELQVPATKDGASVEITLNGEKYLPLDLSALPDGDDDLLGRKPGEDSLFESIKEATIEITNIRNDVLDGLYLGVKTNGPAANAKIINVKTGSGDTIRFDSGDLNPSFNPGFKLLVKSSDPTLRVKPAENPQFDLRLALSATTELNISQKF